MPYLQFTSIKHTRKQELNMTLVIKFIELNKLIVIRISLYTCSCILSGKYIWYNENM